MVTSKNLRHKWSEMHTFFYLLKQARDKYGCKIVIKYVSKPMSHNIPAIRFAYIHTPTDKVYWCAMWHHTKYPACFLIEQIIKQEYQQYQEEVR